ncbi:hypothetical protein EIP91_000161 [Steccherinum ochraceum]|uniref:C3H1-type domain-containing protein n=1 Tax=Steccherinum ochraceum TaxID=92696 RepID=A0A4R0RY15_9APHY|nr:hypothetical protein EIP91_000161 [Steccherinum ochraceum]
MNTAVAPTQAQDGNSIEDNVRHHLFEIAGAVQNLLEEKKSHDVEAAELKADLDITNRGFRSLREEMMEKQLAWERERQMLQSRIAAFENSERRVTCLIDGDGSIFSRDLLAQGSQGGQAAARELSKHIHNYLDRTFQMPPSTFVLSVFVFLHKKGLMEALGRAGFSTEKTRFDEFLAGFNQAGQRFVMVDVGAGKENADSKLKAFLHDNARSPQTSKIFFGGSHDNGYTPDLKSLISDGYGHKLILLPGYTEIASSIRELELDTLLIPNLFLADKLTFAKTPRAPNGALPDFDPFDVAPTPPTPGLTRRRSASVAAAVPLPETPGLPPPGTPSKKAKAKKRKQSKSTNVSEVESVSDTVSSPPESIIVLSPAPPGAVQGNAAAHVLLRNRFDPGPPPCQKHYLLGNCPFKAGCKFGHTYVLTPDDMRDLAEAAKGIPCKEIIKGRKCAMNERCIYGHKCPYGPGCPHLARGICHFKIDGMHDV